jgi:hypothetical protein
MVGFRDGSSTDYADYADDFLMPVVVSYIKHAKIDEDQAALLRVYSFDPAVEPV